MLIISGILLYIRLKTHVLTGIEKPFSKQKKAIKMIDTYITRSLLKSFNLKASQKGNRGYHLDGLGRVNEQDI